MKEWFQQYQVRVLGVLMALAGVYIVLSMWGYNAHTENRKVAYESLNLPRIDISEQAWGELELADKKSKAAWTVSILPDYSAIATKFSESGDRAGKLLYLHRPVSSDLWRFGGYGIEASSLSNVTAWFLVNTFWLQLLIATGATLLAAKFITDLHYAHATTTVEEYASVEELTERLKVTKEDLETVAPEPDQPDSLVEQLVSEGVIDEDAANDILLRIEKDKQDLQDASNTST